jgi:small conductance mechanosensitive channel
MSVAVQILFLILLAQDAPPATTVVTTAPATQPLTIRVEQVPPAAGTKMPEVVTDPDHIDLKKVVSGEQVLTIDQLLKFGPWLQIATDLAVTVLSFIPRLLVALFLLFVFWLIYRGVRRVVVGGMNKAAVDPSISDMLVSILKWSILGFALVIAGNQVGIQIAALLTGVSIIGIAIGLAAQETLANFIAGVVIFWDKPFRIGDWIHIDGTLGQVKRVTFRSTRLTDLDGDAVVFPNTYMLQNKVVNKSTNPVTRVNVPIGIAYKESIDKARQVLLDALKGDKRIVAAPAPEVVVRECGDSSVNLMMHFWITEERYEDAMVFEYLEKAKEALDAAGIEIPFPHVQLLLEKTPAVELLAGNGRAARS